MQKENVLKNELKNIDIKKSFAYNEADVLKSFFFFFKFFFFCFFLFSTQFHNKKN